MKKIMTLCLVCIGCASAPTLPECTKDNASTAGCQIQRANAHTTTFLATSLYYRSGQTSLPSNAAKAISETIRFQKLYDATVHLMSHSLNEGHATQNARLGRLIYALKEKGVPAEKITKKTGKTPLYRNGRKQKELSRRIEVYLEY